MDLNDLIKSHKVDLVVMGTKGSSDSLDKLVGSNTFNFIKDAICPVLAIPPEATFSGINHVTYASDFESEEIIFLQQLFNFAEPFQAKVAIINILTGYELNILSDEQVIKVIINYFPQVNHTIIQIKDKNIPEGIHKFMNENKSDILAIAMHQRNYMEILFHNNIAKNLIYHISLPLLALPEKPYRKPMQTFKHQEIQNTTVR